MNLSAAKGRSKGDGIPRGVMNSVQIRSSAATSKHAKAGRAGRILALWTGQVAGAGSRPDSFGMMRMG
jgi:hypothetical protein